MNKITSEDIEKALDEAFVEAGIYVRPFKTGCTARQTKTAQRKKTVERMAAEGKTRQECADFLGITYPTLSMFLYKHCKDVRFVSGRSRK